MKKKVFKWMQLFVLAGAVLAIFIYVEDMVWPNNMKVFWGQKKSVSQMLDFSNYDAAVDRKRWGERIKKMGPETARQEFESEYRDVKDFRIQHTAAHLFGELLYDQFGLHGLGFCTPAFNDGCYHAFLGKALAKEGAGIFPRIAQLCADSGPAESHCYHGAGHGIVSFFGYEEKDLLPALNVCDTFSSKGANSCLGGVFMEYNFWLLRHGPNIFSGDMRPAGKDINEPCITIPQKFRASCYFSQPDWWKSIFHSDYQKVGELCSTLREPEKTQCFLGTGKIIVWLSPRNIKRAVATCDFMPASAYAALCRSGAAAGIYGRTGDQALAAQMCNGLENPAKTSCLMMLGLPGANEDGVF